MSPIKDTSAQADAVQVRLLRDASPGRRFRMVSMLSDTTRHLSRRAIDKAHPDCSEREKDIFFVRVHYGRTLADQLARYLRAHDRT